MTIRDPFACGFAKVAVYNIMTRKHGIKKEKSEHKYKFKSRILLQQYDEYNTYFNTEINTQLAINYKSFTNTFPKIIDNVRSLSKKGPEIKEHIFRPCINLWAESLLDSFSFDVRRANDATLSN